MEVHRASEHQDDLVAEALRVLGLPIAVSGLHWHPFGVYTIPLAKRSRIDGTWSRRLHIWHPEARPVGEASPYGVHTHSGPAVSHVLTGELQHHLYTFEDGDGPWQRNPGGAARQTAHVHGITPAGHRHELPADQPHSVSKEAWAVSLFEQLAGPAAMPFTTWQRTDVPAERLVRKGPVPLDDVRQWAVQSLVNPALLCEPSQ